MDILFHRHNLGLIISLLHYVPRQMRMAAEVAIQQSVGNVGIDILYFCFRT